MYKILVKRSERGVKSLYEYVTRFSVDTETNESVEIIDEYDDENALKDKVKELLLTRSINDISVVADKTYNVDILFEEYYSDN